MLGVRRVASQSGSDWGCQRLGQKRRFLPHVKINFTWIKEPTVPFEIRKILKEKKISKLLTQFWDEDFARRATQRRTPQTPLPVSHRNREAERWDCVKINHFCETGKCKQQGEFGYNILQIIE